MTSFCDTVLDTYDSNDIYANGNLLAQPCELSDDNVKYDRYCQTPVNNSDFASGCLDLLEEVQDDDNVYNRFVQLTEVVGNDIRSGGYVLGKDGLLEGVNVSVRSGGETLVEHTLLAFVQPLETTITYATYKNPNFRKIPDAQIGPVSVDICASTRSFDVDDNGVVYISYLGDHNFLSVFKFDPASDVRPVLLVSYIKLDGVDVTDTSPMGVSPDGRFLAWTLYDQTSKFFYRYDTQDDVRFVSIPIQSNNSQRPFSTQETLVNNQGNMFTVRCGVLLGNTTIADYLAFVYLESEGTIEPAGTFEDVFSMSKRLSENNECFILTQTSPATAPEDRTRVNYIFQRPTSEFDFYPVDFALGPGGVSVGAFSVDFGPDEQKFYVLDKNTTRIYQADFPTSFNQLIIPVHVANYGVGQTRLLQDIAFSNERYLFYSTTINNVPIFRIASLQQDNNGATSFPLIDRWADEGFDIRLCDNGDIVAIDSNTIVGRTATTDDTVPTLTQFLRGDCSVRLRSTSKELSTNGLYRAATNPTTLEQMVPHQVRLQSWMNLGTADRRVAAVSAFREYADENRSFDPRAFCFENEEGILGSLYNVELLRLDSALFEQLLAVAPCLSQTCQKFSEEDNIIGNYLKQFDCDSNVVFCNQTLQLTENSSIDVGGNFVQSEDCGITNQVECRAGCPVGSVCNENNGTCQLSCSSANSDQCNEFEECRSGLCQLKIDADKSRNINIGLVIAISVVGIVFVTWALVFYIRKRKTEKATSA